MQNLISILGTVARSKKHISNSVNFIQKKAIRHPMSVAGRAEHVRFPLIITINQKIMNYSSYLLSKDNCSTVKEIFFMWQDLHQAVKNSYYSNIINMSEYYNLK